MAKLALINRDAKRRAMVKKYAKKREALQAIVDNPKMSDEDRFAARQKIQQLPRNANPTRVRMGAYQQLVRSDVMRGRFRNGYDKPAAFKPDEPTEISFTMNDICHTFRPGHRLMVQVQSTWFPLVDRNPQTFCDIYTAKAEDFQKATQRVYRGGEQASRVSVTVVK